jgi:hypothetical protein
MSSTTPEISEGLDMSVNPLAQFEDLMSEADVCERYENLLGERELRNARRNNAVAYVTGKKGMILYRPAWIAEYLKRKVTLCQPQQVGSGNTGITGSGASPTLTISTPAGGISAQSEHVVEVLTRKFLPKRETA